jgi:hypothetical protein
VLSVAVVSHAAPAEKESAGRDCVPKTVRPTLRRDRESLAPSRVNGGILKLPASDSSVQGMFWKDARIVRICVGTTTLISCISQRASDSAPNCAVSAKNFGGLLLSILDGSLARCPDGGALNSLPTGHHQRGKRAKRVVNQWLSPALRTAAIWSEIAGASTRRSLLSHMSVPPGPGKTPGPFVVRRPVGDLATLKQLQPVSICRTPRLRVSVAKRRSFVDETPAASFLRGQLVLTAAAAHHPTASRGHKPPTSDRSSRCPPQWYR